MIEPLSLRVTDDSRIGPSESYYLLTEAEHEELKSIENNLRALQIMYLDISVALGVTTDIDSRVPEPSEIIEAITSIQHRLDMVRGLKQPGSFPSVDLGVTDAALNHDKYLYGDD